MAWFAIAVVIAIAISTAIAWCFAKSGFPLPPADRRLGSIDGLRGWLALSVMAHHFFIWTQSLQMGGRWAAPTGNLMREMGAGAVALFFMTTGLVFYPRVLAGWKSTAWISVYINRAFRILPLVIFSVLIITAVAYLRGANSIDSSYGVSAFSWIIGWGEPDLIGYKDTGRINSYVLWSLWYEWIFYIAVLPLSAVAMDLVKKHHFPTWLVPVGLIALVFFVRLAAKVFGHHADPLRYFPLFAIGMLAYELQAVPRIKVLLQKNVISLLGLAALVAAMTKFENPYGVAMPLFGIFFVCVACGNTFFGALKAKSSSVLGEISFGIYLLHGIILDLIFVQWGAAPLELGRDYQMLLLCVAALVIVPITAAAYLFIEKPSISAGRKISKWWTGRASRATSLELEIAP